MGGQRRAAPEVWKVSATECEERGVVSEFSGAKRGRALSGRGRERVEIKRKKGIKMTEGDAVNNYAMYT